MPSSTIMSSPIGSLELIADADGLNRIEFAGDRPPVPGDLASVPVLAQAVEQLTEYFAGERTDFDLPLAPRGTPFQQRVWRALLAIPYAGTTTYGRLARELGSPTASRAVGAANGRNPIPVVIPCHRVIGSNGTLTGYAGGLGRKRTLLDLELRDRMLEV